MKEMTKTLSSRDHHPLALFIKRNHIIGKAVSLFVQVISFCM